MLPFGNLYQVPSRKRDERISASGGVDGPENSRAPQAYSTDGFIEAR